MLGRLACEIEAAGERLTTGAAEPISYGFTWVELDSRVDGHWQRIGNVSSPRP